MKLYKLKKTPSGKKLWTYTAAILEVTNMDKGEVFPLKKFFSNFRTHLKAGRIEPVSNGYKLSEQGIKYFADRYNDENRQQIHRPEVEAMINGIRTGEPSDEWIKIK